MLKKTKIICTIGPSSKSVKILEKLIAGGMDIARINTSHSTREEILEITNAIRDISARRNKNTAILLDLQGPKIRVGRLNNDIELKAGHKVIFSIMSKESISEIYPDKNIEIINIDYKNFLNDIKEGSTVFLDDGLFECRIQKIYTNKGYAEGKIIMGGILKSHKGINLPGVSISIDSVTKRDLEFLHFGIDIKVDFIAQSFVRESEDVRQLMDIIKDRKSSIMVIAKIEKHEAVTNFNSILRQADGIMIARGDLGVEINQEDLPYIQKNIIKKANLAGKPVITATQMLDSMIRNPRPTRAEVSDVANAIIDGSDAVMLSGETAAGKYPVEAFEMMLKIINKTENTLDYQEIIQKNFEIQQKTITDAISFASCDIANDLSSKAIITFTQTGNTARHVSKNKPKCMVIGASPNDWVIRQLMMSWGVIPIKTKYTDNINILIDEAVSSAREHGYIKKGDTVVITGGVMINIPGSTNYINVKEVE